MEGGSFDERNPLPTHVSAMFRDYQLAKQFGWTPEQIAATDAATCDWFLEFARVEAEARRKPQPSGG